MTKPDGTFLGQIVRPVRAAGVYIPGGAGGGDPPYLLGADERNTRSPGRSQVHYDDYSPSKGRQHKPLSSGCRARGGGGQGLQGRQRLGHCCPCVRDRIDPAVDVIVGPGNIYVALAKKLLSGEVGTDMIAGPSEILVLADSSANADYIAADLLSQAEHDSMASAICITTEESLAGDISRSVSRQLACLPRGETAAASIERFGAVFVVQGLEVAFELATG